MGSLKITAMSLLGEPLHNRTSSRHCSRSTQDSGQSELFNSVEVSMNPAIRVLALLASIWVSSCATQADQMPAGAGQIGKVTANGYSKEGCLLNLKIAAREQNVRLKPDDVTMDSNILLLIFPFLNQEAYQCTGVVVERRKRTTARDNLYPID